MNQILPIVGLTIIANFIIAFLVYRKNPRSATNRLLTALAVTTILWTIANYLALTAEAEATRLFWVRAVMFVTTPFGTIIYLLSRSFPGSSLDISNKSKTFFVAFNIFLASIAFTPFIFKSLENLPDGSFNLVPNWGIGFYAIGFMGFMTAGFINLYKKYRKSQGIQKQQLQYFLWGIVISFSLLTATNFIAVNVFNTVQLTALGPPFTLILFIFTSYAIIKHRFLDITTLAARALSYAIILALLMGAYVITLFTLLRVLPASIDQTLVSILLTMLAAYSFNPLKIALEKMTDSIFYQGKYDTQELLAKLTKIMATELSIQTLTSKLLTKITKEMRLTKAAFILIEDEKIENIETLNFEVGDLKNSNLMEAIKGKQDLLVFEELESEKLKALFRKYSVSVVVRLYVNNSLVGLLVLGPKASGNIYNNQDLEFLNIFAPQAAIAIQNAEAFRKIKSFSETLEKRVEERAKELKETQKRELEKAQELLRIKDEFVFIATHDLGTPVTAINGFIYLIEQEKNKFSKETKENLDSLKEASARLTQLTNDLLEVARSESGALEITTRAVDAAKLTADLLKQFGPSAKQQNVTLINKAPEKEVLIAADIEKLTEVLENLLSNAIKYNKKDGDVTVSVIEKKDEVDLIVSDTGIGIPKKDYDKVFQKFSRLHQKGTEEIQGTGLGLFVVRILVEKMNGSITFEPTPGGGTTFIISLPKASKDLKKPGS